MKRTVLVVDDEFDLANTVRAILEGQGYQVDTCANGREATERLKAASSASAAPDLVLMDVMMPLTSGLEVLRWMRGTPALADVPVVLMSVITPSVKRDEYGWQGFLRKPFTLQALVKAVDQHAREHSGISD